MLVKNSNVTTTPEILKRKLGAEYLVPATITGFTNGVCKAGSPIGADGAVANSADAVVFFCTMFMSRIQTVLLSKAFAVSKHSKRRSKQRINH